MNYILHIVFKKLSPHGVTNLQYLHLVSIKKNNFTDGND